MSNRKLFVGSSEEAANSGALRLLISALSHHLPSTVEVVSWQDTNWQNLESALRTLTQSLTEFSYAVFLAWPDDKIDIRGNKFYCCRDNVIFEFGLFLGQIGTERTFLVAPQQSVKLPSDDLEYRILTDIRGTFLAGSYTLTGSPPALRFRLNDLIRKITNLEKKAAALKPRSAKSELIRLIKEAETAVSKAGYPDAYYSGYLGATVDRFANLKAVELQKTVQDAARDLLLFMEYEQDVCDLKQIVRVQHHSVGNLDKVWVFADSPLEFERTAGREFDDLRKVIRENLLNGVQYSYFLTEKVLSGLKVDAIVPSNLPKAKQKKMKGNITFIVVDEKLFKTFFTLHFSKGQSDPSSVYMSLLREERKRDVLIQVADAKHAKRIRENIELLLGSEDTSKDGVRVKRFV